MAPETTKLKIIITGATGMVGEGVMLECLEHPEIEQVLLVSRKPYGASYPKLKECIVPDFMKLDEVISQLAGYDACFFCAGVSSIGMSEADYTHITYDTTMQFARTLAALNPQMVFIYVSGAHTDSTEKGRTMWARVKGRTENDLQKVGFKKAYSFRPGFMKAMPGQKKLKPWFPLFAWLYWPLRLLLPNLVSTLQDVGIAMILCATKGYPKQILEVKDINALAKT